MPRRSYKTLFRWRVRGDLGPKSSEGHSRAIVCSRAARWNRWTQILHLICEYASIDWYGISDTIKTHVYHDTDDEETVLLSF